MNILFFLEPLVKEDKPLRLSSGVWNHVGKLISILSVQKHEFRIIASKGLEPYIPASEVALFQCCFLNDIEMLLPFKMDYLNAIKAWYQGEYSKQQLEYTSDLIKNLLGDFIPDVIIGFTTGAPYLSHAYPEAILLFYEAGMVSRDPFPSTHSLDPFGMYAKGSFVRLIKNIEAIQLNSLQQEKINQFKSFFVSNLQEKQKLLISEEELRAQFRYLILVPLQEPNTVYFNSVSGFNSFLQFILHILSKIPKDIGVIFTTHSAHPYFTPELVSYLRNISPNFLFFPELQNSSAASQILMGIADAVIAVASSVGLQTLIWDKKLITIGNSQLSPITDGIDITDIEDVILCHPRYKDHYLFWLLTYYSIPDQYLNDPDWFNSFLQKCHRLHFEGQLESLYDTPIDEPEKILDFYIKHAQGSKQASKNAYQQRFNGLEKVTGITYDNKIEFSKAYLRNGDVSGARTILLDAIAEKPNYSTAYTYLSKLFLEQGNLQEARLLARKAWKLALGNEDWVLLSELISNHYLDETDDVVSIWGGVNTPYESQTISGLFLIQGWLLSDSPGMVDLEVCLDSQVLNVNVARIHREDVRAAYPISYSVNFLPGFRGYLNTLQYPNGEHILTFRGIFRYSTKVSIADIPVIIRNPKIDGV